MSIDYFIEQTVPDFFICFIGYNQRETIAAIVAQYEDDDSATVETMLMGITKFYLKTFNLHKSI